MAPCVENSQLKRFVNCELNDEQTAEIEAHLAECDLCREKLQQMEKEATPFLELPKSRNSHLSDFSELSQFGDQFSAFIDSETTLELPQIIGFYEIQKVLGKGGMGILYEGEHLMLHRKVAIKFIRHKKILTPEITERFQQEIVSAGKLFHPNIVTTLDAGTFNGQPFLVMELLNGMNMEQYVKQQGALPLHEAFQATLQAAQGLAHAHSFGLIHCDVKPSNLWRCPDGMIKVLDLGLMQLSSALHGTQSHHGGTPSFMSPEQKNKNVPLDFRTDIYSLGCTLYFLLTGKVPESEGENRFSLKAAGVKVPRDVQRILNKMTAPELEKRPKSMEEVEKMLKPYASRHSSTTMVMLGYICMVVSLVIFPIIFGPLAIILGFINKRRGSVFHGRNQIYMGLVCFLIGWAFGVLVFVYNDIIDEAQEISERAVQELEAVQKAEEENSPSPVPQSAEREPQSTSSGPETPPREN